jgi:diguanylate cyclase (GGDEF)-like protein/PAS domain S-box-containing protein
VTAPSTDHQYLLDVDALPFGVIVFDRAGDAMRVNRAWADLTGQTQQRASVNGWLRAVVAGDRTNAVAQVRSALDGHAPGVVDLRLQVSSREPQRWIRARVEPTYDALGTTVGCLAFVEDSDEAHNRELQLEYQATHDALTGVLNRAYFVEQTRHALLRVIRHPSTLAIVFIDLDDFKAVNDLHGHVFGDRVLAAQAQQFHKALRPNDLVARYGGDEFVVLCEDLRSTEEALSVAERIIIDLSQPLRVDDRLIELNASVGVVTTNDPYADLTTLLQQADLAMYRAKSVGPGRVELVAFEREPVDDEFVIDLELERRRDWQVVLTRIHRQLRDAEAALGRLWADEIPQGDAQAAHRLADAARHVSRAVRSLADDVIA